MNKQLKERFTHIIPLKLTCKKKSHGLTVNLYGKGKTSQRLQVILYCKGNSHIGILIVAACILSVAACIMCMVLCT